jgi:hypothetical protein
MCPTVEFIDSGELALACKHLGIAHPTGYPLYTLLGNLISRLPAASLIGKVNWLSLISTALAAGFLFLLIRQITGKHGDALKSSYSSFLASLFIAFSPIWWSQGTTNEVYSLNIFLISVSLWSLFKFANADKGHFHYLALSTYTLGLCLTNHLSVIYLIPGYIYLLFFECRRKVGRHSLLLSVILVLFPLTLYLFLPIRSRFGAFLNWGGVSDPYFFFKHVTGWQYRVWMFTNPLGIIETLGQRIGPAASLIYDQFKWYGLAFLIWGAAHAYIKNRRLLVFAMLIWLANLLYVLNYEIADIETYYLPMILVSSIFIAMGIGEALTRMKGRKALELIVFAVAAILPLANILANYHKADRSDKVFARQAVLDISQSAAAGGLALMENWDFYSPWLYFRFEDGFRPELTLLDKELMRRSWYIDFIRRYHLQIYGRSKAEFDEFLRRVEPFERGWPYDPNVIDRAYYGMLDAVITNESKIMPVYTNITGDPRFIGGRSLIPDGVLFRFDDPQIFLIRPRYVFADSIWENPIFYKDFRVASILSYYGRAFELREKYCTHFGRIDESKYYSELKNKIKEAVSQVGVK